MHIVCSNTWVPSPTAHGTSTSFRLPTTYRQGSSHSTLIGGHAIHVYLYSNSNNDLHGTRHIRRYSRSSLKLIINVNHVHVLYCHCKLIKSSIWIMIYLRNYFCKIMNTEMHRRKNQLTKVVISTLSPGMLFV